MRIHFLKIHVAQTYRRASSLFRAKDEWENFLLNLVFAFESVDDPNDQISMTWSRRQTSLVACASGGRTNQSDGWLFWSMPALEQAPFRLHGHAFLRWPLYENRTTWFGCSFRLTTVCKTSMNWDGLTHAAQFKLFTSSERQRKQQTRPLQQLNARRSGAPFFHVYWLCSNPHWHCFTC